MAPPDKPTIDHNILSWDKDRIIFLHVPKTGGTTLTDLIVRAVGQEHFCPERFNDLSHWPAGLLAKYRIFAGHFDRVNIDVIPGKRKIVTLLREPRARIISTYRFWRSVPRELAVQQQRRLVLAAIDLDFFTFLKWMQERSIHDLDNQYARAFGAYLPMTGDASGRCPLEKLGGGALLVDQAKEFLETCTAVGILEQFKYSVSAIFAALNLPTPPGEIPTLMKTEDVAKRFDQLGRLENFSVSTDAEAELRKLTEYDQEIYEYAVSLFEIRKQENTK